MEIGTRLSSSQTNICDNIQESYHSEGDSSTPRQLADISNTNLHEAELEVDYDEDELEEADEEHFEALESSIVDSPDKDMLTTTNRLDVRAETGLEIAIESTSTAFQAIKAIQHPTISSQSQQTKRVSRVIEDVDGQTSKTFLQAAMNSISHNKKPSQNGPAVSPKKDSTFQTAQAILKETIQHPALDALPKTKEVLPSPNVSPDAGPICLCQPLPKIPRPRNGKI